MRGSSWSLAFKAAEKRRNSDTAQPRDVDGVGQTLPRDRSGVESGPPEFLPIAKFLFTPHRRHRSRQPSRTTYQ